MFPGCSRRAIDDNKYALASNSVFLFQCGQRGLAGVIGLNTAIRILPVLQRCEDKLHGIDQTSMFKLSTSLLVIVFEVIERDEISRFLVVAACGSFGDGLGNDDSREPGTKFNDKVIVVELDKFNQIE